MQLVLTIEDLNALKPATRADIVATLFRRAATAGAASDNDIDWEGVVDLTPDQVKTFMSKVSDKYAAGLRIIAEHGPVIRADLLEQAGIENFGHFQGRITLRTRTVTGDPDAFLFGWDDWTTKENDGVGHYGVTDVTHRSLRKYFRLD
jgi:hypothetical protein